MTQKSTPFSTLNQSTTDQQTTHFGTPAVQIGNVVRDGDKFLMIRQSQGITDQVEIWSSGDRKATEQLYRQAAKQVAGLETSSP